MRLRNVIFRRVHCIGKGIGTGIIKIQAEYLMSGVFQKHGGNGRVYSAGKT